MDAVLKTKDDRWCAAKWSDGTIPECSAQRWAEAQGAILGLPSGSLSVVIVKDGEADPRKGELLDVPPPPIMPSPPSKPTLDEAIARIAALEAIVASSTVTKE